MTRPFWHWPFVEAAKLWTISWRGKPPPDRQAAVVQFPQEHSIASVPKLALTIKGNEARPTTEVTNGRIISPKEGRRLSKKGASQSFLASSNQRSVLCQDPERLRQLFKEAVKKAPTIPRD